MKDLSWYIKWIATVVGTSGMVFSSLDAYPIDVACLCFSTACWMAVGMLWRDRAMVVANAAASAILFVGLIKYFTKVLDLSF